jgi:hypothetical protein
MARPTYSKLLYAQMLGRGTRLHPDKVDLIVLDVVDNSSTHRLPGLHSLFDLPETMDLRGAGALEMERQLAQLTLRFPWIDAMLLRTPEDLTYAAERIEFFNFDSPSELAAVTEFTWFAIPDGFRLPLPDGDWISIRSNLLDSWDVVHHTRQGASHLGSEHTSIAAAIAAEDFVRDTLPNAPRLLDRTAFWRRERPSQKQLDLLARHGIPAPRGLTKGQASQMISWAMTARR